jgi:hypothetical protein
MKLKFFAGSLLIILFLVSPVLAEDTVYSPISAANIRQLQSVLHIDSGDWTPKVERGWLALDPTGAFVAVANRDEEVIILDTYTGERLGSYSILGDDGFPTTFLDAAFSADSQFLASVHVEGGAYYVAYQPIDQPLPTFARVDSSDVPLRVWASQHVWLEMTSVDSNNERYVLQTDFPLAKASGGQVAAPDWPKIASGPENDPDSFLRVGRIAPPLALTATKDALLKRWNLEAGEVTATAQLDALPGAGQLNADSSHLVWIDQQFKMLHLLNFESGEDRVITSLGGTYIPFLLLTPKADVLIGVDVGDETNVVAWDVTNGERIDLGEYRPCNRQPDMVRLSKDGTTVVIGCDAGLDIWRVPISGSN